MGAVHNARALLKVQDEFGTFEAYCWGFVDGRPKVNRWKTTRQIPATSPRIRGVQQGSEGSSGASASWVRRSLYAYMQAIGLVTDHLVGCYRYREILRGTGQSA